MNSFQNLKGVTFPFSTQFVSITIISTLYSKTILQKLYSVSFIGPFEKIKTYLTK